MRKVVFIGGSSFSGSTAFHLMIANDACGFACGELHSLFSPTKQAHANRLQDCSAECRRVWREVRKRGPKHAFSAIFDIFPDVTLVVDSSKNPFWIHDQSQILKNRGIDVHHLLIWKSPLEFAHSRKKRNALSGWERAWINYHRLYSSLLPEWRSVAYRELAVNPSEVLQSVCRYLGIIYFDQKPEFWNKPQLHLGGNYSARIHMLDKNEIGKYESKWIGEDRKSTHKSVYYQPVNDSALLDTVEKIVNGSPHFSEIIELLSARSVVIDCKITSPIPKSIKLSHLEIIARRLKAAGQNARGRATFSKTIDHALREMDAP